MYARVYVLLYMYIQMHIFIIYHICMYKCVYVLFIIRVCMGASWLVLIVNNVELLRKREPQLKNYIYQIDL